MTDERIETVLFEVNGKLASIDAKLDNLSSTILKHEARLCKIEEEFKKHLIDTVPTKDDNNFKADMLKLLGKALMISLLVVGTLTGSAGLIAKILGN